MKKLLLLPLVAIIFACGKKDIKEQSKKAISKYVSSQIGVENIDLNVYKVDTLTEKKRLIIKANEIYDKFNRNDAPILEILEGAVERTKGYYNNYPAEFKVRYEQAVKELQDKQNELMPIFNEIEVLEEKSKTADSLSFIAYGVYAVAKYTTKDNVVKSDSIQVILNRDFNIIEKKDFIK